MKVVLVRDGNFMKFRGIWNNGLNNGNVLLVRYMYVVSWSFYYGFKSRVWFLRYYNLCNW